jgi:hypothetical protein
MILGARSNSRGTPRGTQDSHFRRYREGFQDDPLIGHQAVSRIA